MDNNIERLALSFFKRTNCLQLEEMQKLSWNDQKKLLLLTVQHPHLIKYPADKRHSKLFLKNLLKKLQTNMEIHDDIYECLCRLMDDQSLQKEFFFYQHYIVDNDLNTLFTMKETNRLVIHGTTGLRTWEAALILADWSISNKQQFSNKNVLELGCGTGFTSITISKFCSPSSVYFTDYHEEVLDIVSENISINYPNIQTIFNMHPNHKVFKNEVTVLGVLKLDWNTFEGLMNAPVPDVVIGADIVYDPSILLPLCNVFRELFKLNKNLRIFISCIIRNEDTFKNFIGLLDKEHFCVEKLQHTHPVHIDWDKCLKKCLLQITV